VRDKSRNFTDSLFVHQSIVNLFIDALNLHSVAIPGKCILSREAISCSSIRTIAKSFNEIGSYRRDIQGMNSPASALFNIAKGASARFR